MKIYLSLFLCVFLLSTPFQVFGQQTDWDKLIPLEMDRTDVERILGKDYKNENGFFIVFYSRGGCDKNYKGLQYDIPADIFVHMYMKVTEKHRLTSFVDNIEEYTRFTTPVIKNRVFYTSPDKTTIIETTFIDDEEYVDEINMNPGNKKRHLNCKNLKN